MKIKIIFIFILALSLLTAGCSHEAKVQESNPERIRAKWEAEVPKVIKDPLRGEKIVGLGVDYELKQRAIYTEIDRLNQELMRVNANYDSTRADYEQTLQEFTQKKNEAVRQYLVALFDIRKQTTPAEWKALLK